MDLAFFFEQFGVFEALPFKDLCLARRTSRVFRDGINRYLSTIRSDRAIPSVWTRPLHSESSAREIEEGQEKATPYKELFVRPSYLDLVTLIAQGEGSIGVERALVDLRILVIALTFGSLLHVPKSFDTRIGRRWPSWEQSMEIHDARTKLGYTGLALDAVLLDHSKVKELNCGLEWIGSKAHREDLARLVAAHRRFTGNRTPEVPYASYEYYPRRVWRWDNICFDRFCFAYNAELAAQSMDGSPSRACDGRTSVKTIVAYLRRSNKRPPTGH